MSEETTRNPESVDEPIEKELVLTDEELDEEDLIEEEVEDDDDDDDEFEQQILALLAERKKNKRSKATIKNASRTEMKAMRKASHVVTNSEELRAETYATKLDEDMRELVHSAKAKRILRGVIIGIRSAKSGDEVATWVAEVQYGNDTCTVLIPSYQLYNYPVSPNRTVATERPVHDRMQDMIGAEIDFIVRSFDKPNRVAYASRLEALEKIQRANYIRTTAATKKPRVGVGTIVEGQVIAIRNHAIIVNVLGVDTAISAKIEDNEVSWGYVNDCHSLFRMNDYVTVKVMAMKEEETQKFADTYHMVKIKASIKATEENPMDLHWNTISEGEIGTATVTAITDAGIFCKYKNRVTILCKAPERGTLPTIDQVRPVRVTLKTDDEKLGKRIFGVFITM